MDFLTPQDTFFGRTAYRNKLITQDQLSEAVSILQNSPGRKLGEILTEKGYLTQDQVEAILAIQDRQREILVDKTPAPAPPPAPKALQPPAESKPTNAAALPPFAVPVADATLSDLLAYARGANASDLHLSAGSSPFLRLYGTIHELPVPAFTANDTERIIFAALSNDQKRQMLEKQGLECCIDIPNIGRHRSCVIKQRCGWDATFHIINQHVPSFEELNLPLALKRLTEYTQGLILITGSGNSGKTTTMAAMLDTVNSTRPDHIITIEKPIEYIHRHKQCQITQREVGTHTRTFSAALRAALREDPDIIMVGELRDLATLEMAIAASETGHLVFGTLHTTSAAATVSRIVDSFPVGQQAQIRMTLSESLRGIVSQQLVPRKDGQGVALALEVLLITPAISAILRDNKPHQIPSIMQTSRKMGMCRMDDSLLELANAGTIDGKEAWLRAENKNAFAAYKPT